MESNPATKGGSRHIACKLCRDRKVRCGGEQPACDKCRRSGDRCVYLPTSKSPTKAGLAHTVQLLKQRLVVKNGTESKSQQRCGSGPTVVYASRLRISDII
ncbi:hypothetical protein PG991_001422 [Apiospora marii]|uniref:Zn(2)-C6 fungal-type domain-containing protein n=1 Tax=Apiospora marii TaxID=335849 RepID=A0ABR1SS12_9PEZI